jgi:hypothetical protein
VLLSRTCPEPVSVLPAGLRLCGCFAGGIDSLSLLLVTSEPHPARATTTTATTTSRGRSAPNRHRENRRAEHPGVGDWAETLRAGRFSGTPPECDGWAGFALPAHPGPRRSREEGQTNLGLVRTK